MANTVFLPKQSFVLPSPLESSLPYSIRESNVRQKLGLGTTLSGCEEHAQHANNSSIDTL